MSHKYATFAALLFVSFAARAQVIDFETVPGVASPHDGVRISDQYRSRYGVTFGLDANLDGVIDPGSSAYLAQVGYFTAFQGVDRNGNRDNQPADLARNGQFFLTDDGQVGVPPVAILVSYDTPTAAAYAEILDIDGTEAWAVDALAADHSILQTITIHAGDPQTGDGVATPVRFQRSTADIRGIRFRYAGNQSDGVGLAFDNFSARSAAPLTLPSGFSAETIPTNPQLAHIIALGFDGAGDLLAATFDPSGCFGTGGALYQIGGDGKATQLVAPGAGLQIPWRMLPGPGGVWGSQLYLVDTNAGGCGGRVFRVESNGSLSTITTHNSLGNEPRGIAFPPAGSAFGTDLWIAESDTATDGSGCCRADSGYIERFSPSAATPTVVATGAPLGDPSDAAFGPGGAWGTDLYVSDAGEIPNGGTIGPSIERVDSSAHVSVFLAGQPTDRFMRMAFAPAGPFGGKLYVVNGQSLMAVGSNASIATFATFFSPTQRLFDVVASPDGKSLYVLLSNYPDGPSEIIRITSTADTTKPAISCPGDITTSNDRGSCSAKVTFTATATDDVDGAITPVCVPASGSAFAIGSTHVTCTATDRAGNSSSCSFNVIVNDTEKPQITAPAAVTTFTGPAATACGVVVSDAALGSATATDNCSNVIISRSGVPANNFFAVGAATIKYTATDQYGNTSDATQIVTVVDNTPPTVSASLTHTKDDTYTVDFSATDNCGIASTVAVISIPAGAEKFAVRFDTKKSVAVRIDYHKQEIRLEGPDESAARALLASILTARGVAVSRGQQVRLKGNGSEHVDLQFDQGALVEASGAGLALQVTAVDVHGNGAVASATPAK